MRALGYACLMIRNKIVLAGSLPKVTIAPVQSGDFEEQVVGKVNGLLSLLLWVATVAGIAVCVFGGFMLSKALSDENTPASKKMGAGATILGGLILAFMQLFLRWLGVLG